MARINRWFAFSLLRGLFACLLGVMLTHPAAAAGEPQETKHVLVLYSLRTICRYKRRLIEVCWPRCKQPAAIR